MWDVLYVVDASTSMGETMKGKSGGPFVKIQGVREGISRMVNLANFPFDSRVGVVAFRAPTKALGMVLDSGRDIIQTVLPPTPVPELVADPQALSGRLEELQVGGATPTGEALLRAVDIVHSGPEDARKRIKKLVLVTDDRSNVGPSPEAVLDAKLVNRAIVDVVAVGPSRDRKTFERLASATGGRFTVAGTLTELAVALNPMIPYMGPPPHDPLLEEAARVSAVLNATDRESASHAGIAAAAAAVRVKLERRLQDAVSLEGQARGDLDLVISAATRDPKWQRMSMKEYADRVWSKGADLSRMKGVEETCRTALKALGG